MNFVFLAGLILLSNTIDPSVQDKGSTPGIKEIVIGRCHQYQTMRLGTNLKDCNTIWETFWLAFAYKNPCTIKSSFYEPFFNEVGMQEIKKILFWSKTKKVAHDYADSGARFTTLEDTFVGYLVNDLTWCGNENLPQKTTDGIDYVSCPDWSPTCDYTTEFWGLASKTFALHARDIAYVMLNGSRLEKGVPKPAYEQDSFFGKYELPNLQANKVTELKALLIHTINGPKDKAHCGQGSLKLLKEDALKRNIKFSCQEDPDDVRHILCVDQPKAPDCLFRNPKVTRDQPRYVRPVNSFQNPFTSKKGSISTNAGKIYRIGRYRRFVEKQ